MRTILALLLSLAALPAQRIHVQNLAGDRAVAWVSCGMPQAAAAPTWYWAQGANRRWPALWVGRELLQLADLSPRESHTVQLAPMPAEDRSAFAAFRWSDWVLDDLYALLPTIRCGSESAVAQVLGYEANAARFRVHWRAVLPGWPLTVEGWSSAYSGQDIVEWCAMLSCGLVSGVGAGEQWFDLPSVEMVTREMPVVDWAIRRGLRAPVPTVLPSGAVQWTAEIAAAQRYLRASGVTVRGAWLCGPTRIVEALRDPQRCAASRWRREAPLCAIAAPEAWQGHWGAFGVLPQVPPDAAAEQGRRFSDFAGRHRRPAAALDYEPRPYAQPPYSGTTGEQAEFGASAGEHAVSMGAPWAVWDLLYSAEAETLRAVHNREADGSPVRAADHPRVQMSGRLPDERFSRADMLGWPVPGSWISQPYPSIDDDQHRTDNLLHAMIALTQDPVLLVTVRDILECDRMAYGRGIEPAIGSGAGAPRAVGRTLIASCHAHAAGHPGFESLIRAAVARTYRAALWRLTPEAEVRVLWLNPSGAKSGWLDQGQPITGWVTWEEAIACVGHYAAWRTLGIPEARELALVGATTIARYAWSPDGRLCYALRWHGADSPISGAQYRDESQVVLGGIAPAWVLPALDVLLDLDPQAPEAERAREILARYPVQNWRDACWRAVR